MIRRISVLLTLTSSLVVAGCGGLSDVGHQDKGVPTAIAQVVGYSGADANGDATVSVRAQSEVLLTGKNSIEVDKPIVGFLWEAANDAARQATLTVKNSSTIGVSVPPLATATDLQFKLTVTDSDGDTDTAMVTLKVEPALDSNRFLTFVGKAPQFRVVAATSQPVAATAGFQLQFDARVTYTTRSGVRNTVTYPVRTPIDGAWLSSTGAAAGAVATDVRNPTFTLPLPFVDQDKITREFQAALPNSAPNLSDPAFIDDADMELVLTLTPGAGAATAALFVLGADGKPVPQFPQPSNGGSGTAVQLVLTPEQVEQLRLAAGGLENKDTAASYYAKIDPDSRKLTLEQWLTENCLDPQATDYGADAHAVYVNNFDLGFGRDMYARTTRPASCNSPTFHDGDVASVVVNYATLEGAAKHIDPIIAVAMEYKATDAIRSSPGLVTFYVFAPDEGTGAMRRVSTANFDGRGEKYVPGTCTMCHGGRPRAQVAGVAASDTYNASADLGSTFMPWDLESFLYSDTDATFSTDATNANLRASLTRAEQESQLKKLNAAAYSTFGSVGAASQLNCYAGFEGPCGLVEQWYGGSGLPATTFQNGKIPDGWAAGGGPNHDRPASAEGIYLDVFARNCRACHVQRVREVDPGVALDPQFKTYEGFRLQDSSVKALVFDEGSMPGARLTADRFWTPSVGGKSAGAILAAHLGLDPATARPGAAIAKLALTQRGLDPASAFEPLPKDTEGGLQASRNRPIRLDGTASLFVDSFTHSANKPSSSTASILGSNSEIAEFTPDVPGTYTFVLNVGGSGARNEQHIDVAVANVAPSVSIAPFSVDQGATLTVNAAGGLLSGAADPDGDVLTASLDTSDPTCKAAHASNLVVNANGSFTYTHNGDLATTDQFKVAVTDGYDTTSVCVSVLITRVADTQPPTAPTNVILTPTHSPAAGNTSTPVTVAWTAATDTDQFGNPQALFGYQVQRRTSPAGAATTFNPNPLTALSYTDTTAASNTTYYYTVVAIDQSNLRTPSTQVSVVTDSSFRNDVVGIFSTSLDGRSTCASAGCHDTSTVSKPKLTGTATEIFNELDSRINRTTPTAGRFPCYPSFTCTANHSGGEALVAPGSSTSGAQRRSAYDRIIKWITEGADNN